MQQMFTICLQYFDICWTIFFLSGQYSFQIKYLYRNIQKGGVGDLELFPPTHLYQANINQSVTCK